MASVWSQHIFPGSHSADTFPSSLDHLIGTPLAFASKAYAEKAWLRFADIPALQTPAVKILQASITNVNCEEKVATVTEFGTQKNIQIPYDYFVAASGLRRTKPSAPTALTRKLYMEEVSEHIHKVETAKDGVVVIGAGQSNPDRGYLGM
jgi:NADH dehydrogenase FAD-containing subunit